MEAGYRQSLEFCGTDCLVSIVTFDMSDQLTAVLDAPDDA